MESNEEYHYRFKIVLVGSNGVGKSTLIDRLCHGKEKPEQVDELVLKTT